MKFHGTEDYARLIAKAPEMYEMLKKVAPYLVNSHLMATPDLYEEFMSLLDGIDNDS